MSEKIESVGNCFVCGVELGKIKLKNHVIKAHTHTENGEPTLILKVEGNWNKEYWLFLDIAANATLTNLGRFLRDIWLECCAHSSLFFTTGYVEIDPSTKISDLEPKDKLLYQYDMDNITELLITVMAEGLRPPQKKKVRLLARNVPPKHLCSKCDKPAVYVYEEGDDFFCAACGNAFEDADCLLPVTNSPRMGVCCYDGAHDEWTFDPVLYKK